MYKNEYSREKNERYITNLRALFNDIKSRNLVSTCPLRCMNLYTNMIAAYEDRRGYIFREERNYKCSASLLQFPQYTLQYVKVSSVLMITRIFRDNYVIC